MDSALILGVDPGKTTGACLLKVQRGNLQESTLIKAVQIEWEDRIVALRSLIRDLAMHDNPQIVIEDYIVYKGVNTTGSPVWSARIIGMVEALADAHGIANSRIHYQLAHQVHSKNHAKETGTKVTVKVLPAHLPMLDGARHALDSYAHARLFSLINYTN